MSLGECDTEDEQVKVRERVNEHDTEKVGNRKWSVAETGAMMEEGEILRVFVI